MWEIMIYECWRKLMVYLPWVYISSASSLASSYDDIWFVTQYIQMQCIQKALHGKNICEVSFFFFSVKW